MASRNTRLPDHEVNTVELLHYPFSLKTEIFRAGWILVGFTFPINIFIILFNSIDSCVTRYWFIYIWTVNLWRLLSDRSRTK